MAVDGRRGWAASGLVEVGTRKPHPVHSVWINLGKGAVPVAMDGSGGGVTSGLGKVGTGNMHSVRSVWINLGKGAVPVAVKCCGGQWSVVEDRWLPAALGSGQQFMKIILNFVKIKILQP
jgi:hypothetical protein